MRVLMSGGSGFIGSRLARRLMEEQHSVTVLTRSPRKKVENSTGIVFLEGDPRQRGPWQQSVKNNDIIINLAGASIFHKWTAAYKKEICESRILTTQNIVEAMEADPSHTPILINASAVGYYGFRGDEELAEDSNSGKDFLASVVSRWEEEALKAELKGGRVIIARFGIVLGEKGGALGQMVPLFKAFLGGPIGSGKQWFSWIHREDIASAILFLINHPEASGHFNVCAPVPVRNRELAKALGTALHRPSLVRAPAFMIRLVLGEFGSVILKGQRVVPRKLMKLGFRFRYPEIQAALAELLFRR
jgi:hypothetical protein